MSDYYFQIKAVDNLNSISEPSIEVKYTTHDFVEAPILSSIKDKSNITLIWNEISLAQSYKVYRDDALIDTVNNSFFVDNMLPGESYCYSISCLDKYGLESELSNVHCTKVALKIPSGVVADPMGPGRLVSSAGSTRSLPPSAPRRSHPNPARSSYSSRWWCGQRVRDRWARGGGAP